MRILITGINGFIGSHLSQALIDNGYRVSGTVRSKNNCLNAEINYHIIPDLCVTDYNVLTKGYDIVVHLSALVHQLSSLDINSYMDQNYEVTLSLARSCVFNRVSKFITISSSHVYEGLNQPFKENRILNPQSPYAQSKYKATQMLSSIFTDSDMLWYVIRPPLVYGKGVKGNLRKLSKLVIRMKFVPFGQALSLRSYVAVQNLCGFILHLICNTKSSGVYNVSDNHDLTTNELCHLIAKAHNKKIYQVPVPKWLMKLLFILSGRKDHFSKIYGEFCLNIDKAVSTGWEPKHIDYRDFQS